jgi:hypothetical protein
MSCQGRNLTSDFDKISFRITFVHLSSIEFLKWLNIRDRFSLLEYCWLLHTTPCITRQFMAKKPIARKERSQDNFWEMKAHFCGHLQHRS